jgi:hypothetical protein
MGSGWTLVRLATSDSPPAEDCQQIVYKTAAVGTKLLVNDRGTTAEKPMGKPFVAEGANHPTFPCGNAVTPWTLPPTTVFEF